MVFDNFFSQFFTKQGAEAKKKKDDEARAKTEERQKKAMERATKKATSVNKKTGGSTTQSSSGSGITTEEDAAKDSLGDSSDDSSGDSDSEDSSSGGSSSDGDGSSSGTTSPLLDGSMSFEELVGEICNGIDVIFAVKRSTVVVTDYQSIYAEAKYLRDNYHTSVQAEDIALWQLEDGTYELDVSEYGFYNTVKVHYKNGTVTESYEDLVRVYGQVVKEYNDKDIDKTTAIMKAKAYLAAHVRDFDMNVKANLLHDAEIDIGDIVTLENPQTMRDAYRKKYEKRDPEYFFVNGNSISWEGEGPILNSIELRYGAKSPNKKEVPESGTGGYLSSDSSDSSSSSSGSSDVDKVVASVAKKWKGIKYSSECQTYECVQKTKAGDCWGCSDTLACELEANGVKARIKQYPAYTSNHRSVQYKDGSVWKNFPYRKYGFSKMFRDTSAVSKGKEVSKTC